MQGHAGHATEPCEVIISGRVAGYPPEEKTSCDALLTKAVASKIALAAHTPGGTNAARGDNSGHSLNHGSGVRC